MDGVQFAFLNQLLDTFRNASVTGMVNLKPAALGLVTVLGILDVTAMWGLYFGEMRVREIMGKVIKIGFLLILILNWGPITTAVEDTFVKVGQIASAHQTATKPSSIMVEGTKKMYRLWNNAIYDIPMADNAVMRVIIMSVSIDGYAKVNLPESLQAIAQCKQQI